MPKLPALRGNEVIRVLEKVGFQVIRQKGSPVRIKNEDGRVAWWGAGLLDVSALNLAFRKTRPYKT